MFNLFFIFYENLSLHLIYNFFFFKKFIFKKKNNNIFLPFKIIFFKFFILMANVKIFWYGGVVKRTYLCLCVSLGAILFFFENYLNIGAQVNNNKNFKDMFSFKFINNFFFITMLRYFSIFCVIIVTYIYINFCVKAMPLFLIIYFWLIFGVFIYILISGYVYFVKKNSYNRFTILIDSFWKRSFSLFWLIESGLFVVFIYLTVNSSSEVFYFNDQGILNKNHLYSFKFFFFKLVLINFLIIFMVITLLNLNSGIYNISTLQLFIITSIIFFSFWLEYYQFYYFLINFNNFFLSYSYNNFLWLFDFDFKKIRVSNNFVSICVVARFWHFIFILAFWAYTLSKVNCADANKIQLFNTNLQNFLILYIMNWISLYPWAKYLFKKYLNITYFWFFNNFNDNSLLLLLNGFYNLYFNLILFIL